MAKHCSRLFSISPALAILIAGVSTAYAAAYVILDALRRTKSYSNEDIKKSLIATDMTTAFGPVKFQSYGKVKDQNKVSTYVVKWINGKPELVWPADVATKKFVYPVDWLKSLETLIIAKR